MTYEQFLVLGSLAVVLCLVSIFAIKRKPAPQFRKKKSKWTHSERLPSWEE